MLPGAAFDAVVKAGKIEPASATRIAQALLVVGVRAGAPKPDVSTVDAFKAALLAASSITYTDPAAGGAAGIQIGRVIERLGMTDQLKARTTLLPGATTTETADAVAKGRSWVSRNSKSSSLRPARSWRDPFLPNFRIRPICFSGQALPLGRTTRLPRGNLSRS